jgi:hypothetical protein
MLKGKNLLIIAGVAAVGYYLYKKNQAAKVIAPSTAATNFTGNLGVLNADGAHLTDRQINRIANASPERAQRIYNRVSKRMGIR